MPNKLDSEFIHMGGHLAKATADSFNQSSNGKGKADNSNSLLKIFLVVTGLLSVLGEEPVKVLLRKNFGLNGLSLYKLIASFIIFFSLSALLFYLSYSDSSFSLETGSSNAHFLFGILYSILAFLVLWKGFEHMKQAKNIEDNSAFTGHSHVLSFLLKDGWKQYQIQYIFEPVLVIAIGSVVTMFDRIAGVPIIFCAVSVWLSMIVRQLVFGKSQQATVDELNNSGNNDSFNEVS